MEKNKCENCDPYYFYPGKAVRVDDQGACYYCGGKYQTAPLVHAPTHWDHYFMEIADVISRHSKCASRQLGAVLVRDRYIIATGYNGPPRGVSHCGNTCPRRDAGYASGEGLHVCPAAHAEVNCIATCARLGINTEGTTLYLNWVVPCKNCAAAIINAGIVEVVHSVEGTYDSLAWKLFCEGGVVVRKLYDIPDRRL